MATSFFGMHSGLCGAIHSGTIGARHGRSVEEMQAISGALALVSNVVMAWNMNRPGNPGGASVCGQRFAVSCYLMDYKVTEGGARTSPPLSAQAAQT